jgi:anti-sigma B factor antagonist
MEVVMTKLKETPLLETQGDIDHNTCETIGAAFDKALEGGAQIVLLDLSQVSYIDSGGLSVLFSVARRLRPDGWLGVIDPNSNIRRLLELVGLLVDPSFRVFPDRGAATADLPS